MTVDSQFCCVRCFYRCSVCYKANTEHVKATMEDEVLLQGNPGILLQLSNTLNTTIISIKCHVFCQELNLNFQKNKRYDPFFLAHILSDFDRLEQMEVTYEL